MSNNDSLQLSLTLFIKASGIVSESEVKMYTATYYKFVNTFVTVTIKYCYYAVV